MRTAPYLILVALTSASAFAQTAPTVDGFDYPFGPPGGLPRCQGTVQCTGGWQNVQDFRENNHLGEDWNFGFGDDDLGSPVYAVANGEVMFAGDGGANGAWKGVIIVKHHGTNLQVPGGAPVSMVTSMYAHLDVERITEWVTVGASVTRGRQIGVIGPTPVGSTGPHLHFEVRTDVNLGLGPGYSSNANGWVDPSDFIDGNRIRSVVAWGRNEFDLGNVPSPNTRFVDVAGGYAHSLGLKTDGSIVAWGANNFGQTDVPSPNTGFVAVAAGDSHSLGLKDDGSIVAWGCGAPYNFGQCDLPSPNTDFVAVVAGHSHSLGLKDDGSIVAWGADWWGQTDVPSSNTGFLAVAAGAYHSLALKADRSIIAWGRDDEGQTNVPSPNTGFTHIAAGGWHSIGLRGDGSIVAWGCGGSENFGQCNAPALDTRFVQVAGGVAYTLGLKADGSILVWGCGNRYSPSYGTCNIPSPNTGFVAVAAGAYHGLGIKRASADFDGDGDVDLGDFAPFTQVMKGPFAAPGVSRWHIIDLDPDDDDDLRDLAVWQNAFTGP